jgi:protein-L-isoaspartate(D-aspartate) O-methyltransferase
MNDFLTQRRAMVDSQVRPSDITDRRIPRAMLAVERERFVPAHRRAVAYMDGHIRLSDADGGRFLLAPRLLAKLLQSLDLSDDAVVLDIGCGSGYSTAVIARIASRVVALESDEQLAREARALLGALAGVKVATGPLVDGVADEGPYDGILVNGAVEVMPPALLDQLKDGGRLVAVQRVGIVGAATLWQRSGTHFDARTLFEAEAPLLPGFQRKPEFVF